MRYLPHTDILCLEYDEYIQEGVLNEILFWQQKHRKEIDVHGNGSKALIEYESIPYKYKALIKLKYGDPYQYAATQPIRDMVKKDKAARKYFTKHILPTGNNLELKYQNKYSTQADWLNMISLLLEDKTGLKSMLHVSIHEFWKILAANKKDSRLPTSQKRLAEKLEKYQSESYPALVETYRFTQQNARIVTPKIENLLLSLYAKRHGRATLTQVVRDYNDFILGNSTPVDLETGEVFDVKDFLVKNQLYELAPATVRHYLNRKENRETIDMIKLGQLDWSQKHKPHNWRIQAQYSFSKISMDDYLPPFKTPDGKRTVWMYVIFDSASRAIVGVAYGTEKRFAIVIEAMKDMFRLCIRMGWGLPSEIEMEKSLNWEHRGSEESPDIFTKGEVFPFVRFESNNPQGKNAENFLKFFKYEELADAEGFLGRPHGRNENYKLNRDKKETRYMTDALIAMLKDAVKRYNEAPHPVKKNLSRWEYLCQNQNPDAVKNSPHLLMPYIGYKTETSIHRRVVKVQNEWYKVPADIDWHSDVKGRVQVKAYWIPAASTSLSDLSSPDTVYLYQDNKFLCECGIQERYHDAQAERTEKDWEIMGRQSARQKDYERKVKDMARNIQQVDTIKVQVPYNKLEQETEEYELAVGNLQLEYANEEGNSAASASLSDQKQPETPEKMHKKSVKQGGYVQKNEGIDYATYGISTL